MPRDINELLQKAVAYKASDIHLKAGSPPYYTRHRETLSHTKRAKAAA
ncbi:MAG TPA: hypothetical protein VJL89_13595 [Thermodesulfovibrionia bacterium]|nr:hypothetical protein [Thermodesulfovibrionia bacterium]